MSIATPTEHPTNQTPNNQAPNKQIQNDQDKSDRSPPDQTANQDPAEEKQAQQELAAQRLDEYLSNEYDYQRPRRGDIREGTIVEATENHVVVDIGFKREGFVREEDLSRLDEETLAEIEVGATIPVFVLRPTDREGHPVLSIHQARLYEDWLKAEQMMKEGKLYEGEVSGFNRGGLIVRFGKIRGFVPASQVVGIPRRLSQDERRRRLSEKVGEQIGLKIIEVDRRRRRLIFSQRRALRAWQERQRARLIAELEVGEVRRGTVSDITDFGAFVNLGGADGLIHVSEMSWRRVDNPREVVKVGQELDVYVLNVDAKRKRIALSLKKLEPDPWTLVDEHYQVGQLVEGRVTRALDFGAFIQLDLGIEGLLHVSEMIGTPELRPKDLVQPNEKLLVKVIRIESHRRRIALSSRQVSRSEWERWMAEQQAAETQEAEADEGDGEETAKPESAAEVEASKGSEEESVEPEASEAGEEETAKPEAEAGESGEEETAEPEAEAGESGEEETAESKAEAGESGEEETAEPEAEAGESDEEETAEPEAEVSEAREEETAEPEISETGEEEAETPEGDEEKK